MKSPEMNNTETLKNLRTNIESLSKWTDFKVEKINNNSYRFSIYYEKL